MLGERGFMACIGHPLQGRPRDALHWKGESHLPRALRVGVILKNYGFCELGESLGTLGPRKVPFTHSCVTLLGHLSVALPV